MGISGPNLDKKIIQLMDCASFYENYTKLYFESKQFKFGLNRGWQNMWCPFFKESALSGQYQMLL